jgi:cell division protein FtsI (penicillin-binding protein 3)
MKKENEIQDTIENRDRIHVVMFFVSIVVLVLSVFILARIIHIQASYNVDPKVVNLFRPLSQRHVDEPVRGRILSTDGRPFAISAPLYDIYMDCTIRKREFEEKGDAEAEQTWREKARELCSALSREFGDKSADQYYSAIIQGREKGSKYLSIKKNIDLNTLRRVQGFPLFQEGGYRGGIIVESHEERIYPYDSLARRVIGYVKDTLRKGLEANFDYELHGKAGYEWRRVTDDNSWIRDLDSTVVLAQDGNDIRTTLNVDFQDIADRALRKQINENDGIRAGIVIIMEAQTGAVRAMVNLSRGATPQTTLWERENLCLTEVGEQGSVMKTVTLLSVVEDGYVKNLEQTLPTNNGFVPGGYKQDVHILDYQRETGRRDITVMHGFEISSNYVFTWLAENYYGSRPQELFDHIYSYRLGEAFDFDISGLGTPVVNRPGTAGWSKTTLGTTAYGYGISVTPLHVATFYNGIANKGRMMKPYLVESVEKDGRVIKRYEPSVLNNICSRNTADTVTRALRSVVMDGTATRLKGAKLSVAGKTGTAQVVLTPQERAGSTDPYHDPWGRKKNQGTFVGFFPADNPKYTILCTVYSYLSGQSFYGGTLPALAVREIVDKIYALDPEWEKELHRTGSVPVMKKEEKEP